MIGTHRVVLCDRHAEAVVAALSKPQEFDVVWGEWGRDILKRLRRRLDAMRQRYASLPEDDADDLEWYAEPSERERIGWAIEELESVIEGIGEDRPPIMRIRELERHVSG